MSVTVYVEGWHEDPEGIYPGVNFSNGNWACIAEALGLESGPEGIIPAEDLADLAQACIRLANSESLQETHARPASQDRNVINFGIDKDYLARAARNLLTVIRFAQNKNVGLYWA